MRRADFVVIGAGPAGVAAAVQAERLGLKVLLIDESGEAGGLIRVAHCVENYPGLPPSNGREFAAAMQAHLTQFALSVSRGRVQAVVPENGGFRIETSMGPLFCLTVAAAVGTAAKRPDIEGAETLLDSPLQVLRAEMQTAAIIGSGEAASDYALSLADDGIGVTLLIRGDRLKARGRLARAVNDHPRIALLYGVTPVRLAALEKGVTVYLKGGIALPFTVDCALTAVGRASRSTEILKGLDLGGPETVSTPLPGLFVIGDARTGTLGQAGIAVGDGLSAAMRAANHIEANTK